MAEPATLFVLMACGLSRQGPGGGLGFWIFFRPAALMLVLFLACGAERCFCF
jgi:hypothetical protein